MSSTSFREKNRKVMQVMAGAAIVGILLLAAAFYLQTHVKDPPYYQIWRQQNGALGGEHMTALSSPIITQDILMHWAEDAACSIYTYDQAHYQQQLQDVVSTYFTQNGGASFTTALQKTGVLSQVVSQKLEVTAVVQDPPAILASGSLLGKQVWKVQMPILVTYVTASQKQAYRFIVTMLIVRVPTWQLPSGIGIDELWVTRG